LALSRGPAHPLFFRRLVPRFAINVSRSFAYLLANLGRLNGSVGVLPTLSPAHASHSTIVVLGLRCRGGLLDRTAQDVHAPPVAFEQQVRRVGELGDMGCPSPFMKKLPTSDRTSAAGHGCRRAALRVLGVSW
jgi:hypothetical protein